jgi:ATP-dependent Lon protease
MGCVANIVQSLKLPDGNIKVLVEGIERARAVEWKEDKGFFRVVVKVIPKHKEPGVDAESTMSRVVSLFEQYVKLSNNLHYDAMIAAVRVDDPGKLADTIAAHCSSASTRSRTCSKSSPRRAPEPHRRHPRSRGGQAPGRSPHPVSREEADGEGAEGVLPQREDEGDPEGTGRKDEKGNEIDELKKKIEQRRCPRRSPRRPSRS